MPIIRRTRLFNAAYGVFLVVLAVVMWSTVRTARVPVPHNHGQHNQENTICGIKQSCSPDDGHNDARNILRVN
jgi:lysylphosphatidylglycerol synthetase-like protein (DUF2156 family)